MKKNKKNMKVYKKRPAVYLCMVFCCSNRYMDILEKKSNMNAF